MGDTSFTAPDGWLEYADWRGQPGTVVGRVLVRPGVRSEAFGTVRHLLVLLPPSLAQGAAERRYPVVYLHDGQNVFDAGTSFSGEWRIDETMQELAAEGLEAIVVGIPNADAAEPALALGRSLEYSPTPYEQKGGGRADDYLAFVARTVKPIVDAAFPTLTDRAATGIAGSSLGGLVSLHALATLPDVFGFAGIVSPALWYAQAVATEDTDRLRPGPRIYVDVGGREGDHEPVHLRAVMNLRYLDGAREYHDALLAKGFTDGDDLLYVEDADAIHHESAWAARAPGMLRFLLRPWSAG